MKKRIALTTAVVAVVALLGGTLLYAAPHGRRGPEGAGAFGPFSRLGRLQEELNLSDQQVDQIKSIFADLREQNAQYREQIRGGIGEVAQTLINNPNDVAAAQALLDRQNAAEAAMKSNGLTAMSKALNVLTADQRAKLGQLLAERQQRRHRD